MRCLRAWACVRKVFEASRSVARAFDLLSRLRAAQFTCERRKNHTVQFTHRTRTRGGWKIVFTPKSALAFPVQEFFYSQSIGFLLVCMGQKIFSIQIQIW